MKRILRWFGAATFLCTLAIIPLGTTSATALPLGVGSPTCSAIVGKLSFHPALKTGGTATNEGITIKGKVTGCTGGLPTPTSGKIIGKGVIHGLGANNCASYFPTGVMTFTGAGFFVGVKWANVVATDGYFPTLTFTNSGAALPEIFSGTATTVTGSYTPTEILTLQSVLKESVITGITPGNCGAIGGLKHLAFGAAIPATF